MCIFPLTNLVRPSTPQNSGRHHLGKLTLRFLRCFHCLFRVCDCGFYFERKNVLQNSLDAGIQDSSTSISIVVKFEEMSELDDGDESDKRI